MTNWTDPVNPFTASGSFNTSNARKATFNILGELIQMSCMDLLDELGETRRAIVAANRADLDAKLGAFPFDQAEALSRARQWRAAPPLEKFRPPRFWT
jgi:hypothetical protein